MTEKKLKQKRAAPISYRPPKGLRDEFADRVARSGLSTSAFITKAVFAQGMPRQSRRPAACEQDIARLLAQMAQLSDSLKTFQQTAGDDAETNAVITAAYGELCEIRAALFKALGRQP